MIGRRPAWVLLSAVGLVAGCGTAAGTPAAPANQVRIATPSTPTASCTGGIHITAGTVDAAMGLLGLGVELRNCGKVAYRVDGYPVVRLLDEQRRPLDVTIGNGSEPVSAPDSYDA